MNWYDVSKHLWGILKQLSIHCIRIRHESNAWKQRKRMIYMGVFVIKIFLTCNKKIVFMNETKMSIYLNYWYVWTCFTEWNIYKVACWIQTRELKDDDYPYLTENKKWEIPFQSYKGLQIFTVLVRKKTKILRQTNMDTIGF